MARLATLALAAILIVAPALACHLCPAGSNCCSTEDCDKLLGTVWWPNGTYTAGQNIPGKRGNNYEPYCVGAADGLKPTTKLADGVTYMYEIIGQVAADGFGACCKTCAQTEGCSQYRYFDYRNLGGLGAFSGNMPPCDGGCGTYDRTKTGRSCILLKYNGPTKNRNGQPCAPGDLCWPSPEVEAGPRLCNNNRRSYYGGNCSPAKGVSGDPHFTGADGVRFEFNGLVDKSFCLITDKDLHVNMVLSGYYDSNTYGASVTADGKAIRSWITRLVFRWLDASRKTHTLVLRARGGKRQSRGEGFLGQVNLDGEDVAIPSQEGASVESAGMILTLMKQDKLATVDVDEFQLTIDGKLKASLSLRPAHRLLQTPTEAYVHFNLRIDELNASPAVHGVLGQTFRDDVAHTVKALEFRRLTTLLHHAVHADGADGKGYLDGKVEDYLTSASTAADCKFAQGVWMS